MVVWDKQLKRLTDKRCACAAPVKTSLPAQLLVFISVYVNVKDIVARTCANERNAA